VLCYVLSQSFSDDPGFHEARVDAEQSELLEVPRTATSTRDGPVGEQSVIVAAAHHVLDRVS
jgi:hypothetical protein